MVNPALQSAIEALSIEERLELVEYIESTVDAAACELSEVQKATIERRAAELEADPSSGLTLEEFEGRLRARIA